MWAGPAVQLLPGPEFLGQACAASPRGHSETRSLCILTFPGLWLLWATLWGGGCLLPQTPSLTPADPRLSLPSLRWGPSATHVFVFGADESVSFLFVCAAAFFFFSWLGLAGRCLPIPQTSAVLRGHQRAALCGFSGTLSLLQVLGQGAQSEHGGERGGLGQVRCRREPTSGPVLKRSQPWGLLLPCLMPGPQGGWSQVLPPASPRAPGQCTPQ